MKHEGAGPYPKIIDTLLDRYSRDGVFVDRRHGRISTLEVTNITILQL